MSRTESIVVSVPPALENAKIAEMSMFAWSLQSRQEIVGHIRKDTTSDGLVTAILRGAFEGATSASTTEYVHYVKLHFVRELSLPDLQRIRQLESEYRSLPAPPETSLKGPGYFTLFGVVGIVGCLIFVNEPGTPGWPGVIMYVIWTALGFLWMWYRLSKRE